MPLNIAWVQWSVDTSFPAMLESPEFDRLTPEERDLFLMRFATRCLEYIQDKENF